MNPKPLLAEAAPRKASPWWDRALALGDVPAHLLHTEGFSAHGGDLYALYADMLEKDGHLYSVLQSRKNGVLARERSLAPASETGADRRVAAAVSRILDEIPNFSQILAQILDAIGSGFSVQEILWKRRDDGRVGVHAIKSRHPGRFAMDAAGRLRLVRHPGAARFGAMLQNDFIGDALPDRKFLVFVFGARPDSPNGRGLLARAYWYWWLKKNNLKFWAIYNEKFGMPTAVARCGPGTGEEERKRLLEVLESLQSDSGIVIPESVALEFLESRSRNGGQTFREFGDWCNDEMSKIALGETLTASEGRRSGSLALARVHDEVRNEYIESDARDLMAVVNGQLIRWIVDFNFGPGTPAPAWTIDDFADEDLERQIAVDRGLLELGIPLSREYFYERYRRPAPRESERALRYDDSNLFQYHLRYGVLTVNEVRRSLGLDEVPWGDTRTGVAGEADVAPPKGRAGKSDGPSAGGESRLERNAEPPESEPAEA